ncbi:MAG TPA: DUF1292 domain-containing protein [Fastidiosipila sp.]|jgi:uncharacterized protein YrzB (UPF0473 family)|nr:DUF1292 domain-containing protein [Fastidiosipila sp.]
MLKNWFLYQADDGASGHSHADDDDSQIIVMVDSDTGEEYAFEVVDHFDFEDETYTVLITVQENEDDEAEWIIAKVVSEDDGTLGLESLGDPDGDRVYEEYERILAEEFDDEYDEDEDED